MAESEDTTGVKDNRLAQTVIDQMPSATDKPKAKMRRGLRLSLLALVALLIFGGGVWLAFFVQEALPGLSPQAVLQPPDPRIGEVSSQVERFNTRLSELEKGHPLADENSDVDVETLKARADAMEARPELLAMGPSSQMVKNLILRMDNLESLFEKSDKVVADQAKNGKMSLDTLRKEIAKLNARFEALNDALGAGEYFVGAAVFIAVGEFRRQLDKGDPYRREFARLESLIRQGRAVDPVTASYLSILSKHADSGVAKFDLLEESYAAVADLVIEGQVPAETGIWQRAWRGIASVVRVRRVGEIEGDTPEAIISRAQARLDEGDVAGAVEELAGLSPSSDAVASWIDAAVAYMQTREALRALEQRGVWGDARARD